MADIDHSVYAQSEQQPRFAREISRLQNGKFRVRILGDGWWRFFRLVYRGLSLTQAEAIRTLHKDKTQAGETFTFDFIGVTETGIFESDPVITELAPGNYQVSFDVREDRVTQSGSGSWPFTVADRSSRFQPESGIAITESISGVADHVNIFRRREVGRFIWVTDWLTTAEYASFRDDYNTLQDQEFNVVWPLDSNTYAVWFGEVPWQIEQNGPLYRLTIMLEMRKAVNSGSDYYRTEGGDFYRTEGGDRYLVE